MNSTFPLLVHGPVLLFVFIFGAILPQVTRRELFFGVSIPESLRDSEVGKKLMKSYRRSYFLSATPLLAIIFVLIVYIGHSLTTLPGILLQLTLIYTLYAVYRKRVKELKSSDEFKAGLRKTSVADTTYHHDIQIVGRSYFLIPIFISAINLVFSWLLYDSLPDRLPMHWNMQGEIDGWAEKSPLSVSFIPSLQIFITLSFLAVCEILRKARQQLSATNPQKSRSQSLLFRRYLSLFLLFMAIWLSLLMNWVHLQTLDVIKLTAIEQVLGIALFTIIVLAGLIALTVKVGQAGSRLKVKAPADRTGIINRDDDSLWRGGLFYYNPDDPALWIEKRYGIGYTLNFASWKSWAFIGFIVLICLGLSLIPLLMQN